MDHWDYRVLHEIHPPAGPDGESDESWRIITAYFADVEETRVVAWSDWASPIGGSVDTLRTDVMLMASALTKPVLEAEDLPGEAADRAVLVEVSCLDCNAPSRHHGTFPTIDAAEARARAIEDERHAEHQAFLATLDGASPPSDTVDRDPVVVLHEGAPIPPEWDNPHSTPWHGQTVWAILPIKNER